MLSQAIYRCLLAMAMIASWAAAYVIMDPDLVTSQATLPAPVETLAPLPKGGSSDIYAADPRHECDGRHKFFCPQASGTCYTGEDGFIGCCSTTGCAARTKCMAYDPSGVEKCDINSGGCWSCSDPAAPSCVTISNVMESQHIFYCSDKQQLFLSAYENLVTVGSMAFPPGHTTTTEAPSTGQTPTDPTPSATNSLASSTNTVSTSNLSSEKKSGLSTGAIAGTAVGVVCILIIVAIVFFLCYRRQRKRRDLLQHAGDASYDPRNSNMSQKASDPSSHINGDPDTPGQNYTEPKSPGYVATSNPNGPDDYNSFSAAGTLATPENGDRGVFEMGTDAKDSVAGRAEMGSEGGNATGGSWNSAAKRGNRDTATELESSSARGGEGGLNIQKAAPSSRSQPGKASYLRDEDLSERNQRAFSANSAAGTDSNGISPALTSTTFDRSTVVSPLLSGNRFSTTPSMELGQKQSAGELNPRATIDGPLNWPTVAGNRNSSKLTSATGWESKYLSPEMAISEGFSAGDEVGKDANMAPESDSGPSDATFLRQSRVPR
ncbi:hypothetical protein V494_02916 [Pseudogymnoascus sp. VKM F-4513 (FW-928)]|nr:hypothetical protein V494_02916 [Pseudogymnoascus sp. VKM F-4513 (FW-928)]